MKKIDLDKSEFFTSLVSSLLLYVLTIYRYVKAKPFWYLILIVAILMSFSAYQKYKEIKD